VEISSSNFPRFDRNLNTGGNNYDETEGVVAHRDTPFGEISVASGIHGSKEEESRSSLQ